MEHANPRPIVVPCHRVVYSDGGLGGYGAPEGVAKKIKLLKSEGIEIKDGKIMDFEDMLFSDFQVPKPAPLKLLRDEQLSLRSKVILNDKKSFDQIQTAAGIDVSYTTGEGLGAVVVMDIKKMKVLERKTVRSKVRFPYIPTYLSYHELPVALELLGKLENIPDVVIFDGNGVLHPYGLGLASHAGIILNIQTLGIAKKLLCGQLKPHGNGDDRIMDVVMDDNLIGYGLLPGSARTRFVYASPGNFTSFENSLKIAQHLCGTGHPEPIRLAHSMALELRRKYENVK
jgi:deoxyribonuclease V